MLLKSSPAAQDDETTNAATTPPRSEESQDEEEYTIVQTGSAATRRPLPKLKDLDDDEPLIDTTVALPLNSKKTKRLQKQQLKKKKRTTVRTETTSFLELPAELLEEVISHLIPTEISVLLRLNKATRAFILANETSITRSIIGRRYSILAQCFPLPYPLSSVPAETQAALLNPRRQELINIHRRPYQHIKPLDAGKICTCTTCLLAWNNLNLILDVAHFQPHLETREPIPMIPRGTAPEWNLALTDQHARVVEHAMQSRLVYASILQTHLASIVNTLTRQQRLRPAKSAAKHHHNTHTHSPNPPRPPKRLYNISTTDISAGTDAFLARAGPPSYEFPFHRDNYYTLQAYVPNRKWSESLKRWMYYDGSQHDKDLALARQWYLPQEGSVLTAPVGLEMTKDAAERAMVRIDKLLGTGNMREEGGEGGSVLPIR
ncbi:Hypothetical protein R9X50_00010600 [Acrodontium crateriforme]|uniref:F-box domain-containing protein n=1 Tax=Acrodontium crateriforme TaxID=150365 RepID=A0AAQ3LX70_9PEZI|nr:Hypothetical protein R9X50_00010600 [Acrodontium crateriforme]